MSKFQVYSFFIIIGLLMLVNGDLVAQCPMCRIAAESNLENGGTAGQGLNTGILYMLLIPYLLIGTLGFLWYKNRRNNMPAEDANIEFEREIGSIA